MAVNWEAVSAIGEIVGAIAVVVTLAYLAVQIRQNTQVARSTARQAITQTTIDSSTRDCTRFWLYESTPWDQA